MEFKDRGSFGEQPIETQLDLLGHGLSHVKGELLSINNLIKHFPNCPMSDTNNGRYGVMVA